MSKNTGKPVIKNLANKVRTAKRKFVGVIGGTVLGLVVGFASARRAKRLSNSPHRDKR